MLAVINRRYRRFGNYSPHPGRARLRRALTRFGQKKSRLDGVSPYRDGWHPIVCHRHHGLNSYPFCTGLKLPEFQQVTLKLLRPAKQGSLLVSP